ncbi:hypothetical protein PLESTF_000733600 [Pleodorina starrii]|nr:hypothetical protein PLESTF_000733600 [Pleodorina starrii]
MITIFGCILTAAAVGMWMGYVPVSEAVSSIKFLTQTSDSTIVTENVDEAGVVLQMQRTAAIVQAKPMVGAAPTATPDHTSTAETAAAQPASAASAFWAAPAPTAAAATASPPTISASKTDAVPSNAKDAVLTNTLSAPKAPASNVTIAAPAVVAASDSNKTAAAVTSKVTIAAPAVVAAFDSNKTAAALTITTVAASSDAAPMPTRDVITIMAPTAAAAVFETPTSASAFALRCMCNEHPVHQAPAARVSEGEAPPCRPASPPAAVESSISPSSSPPSHSPPSHSPPSTPVFALAQTLLVAMGIILVAMLIGMVIWVKLFDPCPSVSSVVTSPPSQECCFSQSASNNHGAIPAARGKAHAEVRGGGQPVCEIQGSILASRVAAPDGHAAPRDDGSGPKYVSGDAGRDASDEPKGTSSAQGAPAGGSTIRGSGDALVHSSISSSGSCANSGPATAAADPWPQAPSLGLPLPRSATPPAVRPEAELEVPPPARSEALPTHPAGPAAFPVAPLACLEVLKAPVAAEPACLGPHPVGAGGSYDGPLVLASSPKATPKESRRNVLGKPNATPSNTGRAIPTILPSLASPRLKPAAAAAAVVAAADVSNANGYGGRYDGYGGGSMPATPSTAASSCSTAGGDVGAGVDSALATPGLDSLVCVASPSSSLCAPALMSPPLSTPLLGISDSPVPPRAVSDEKSPPPAAVDGLPQMQRGNMLTSGADLTSDEANESTVSIGSRVVSSCASDDGVRQLGLQATAEVAPHNDVELHGSVAQSPLRHLSPFGSPAQSFPASPSPPQARSTSPPRSSASSPSMYSDLAPSPLPASPEDTFPEDGAPRTARSRIPSSLKDIADRCILTGGGAVPAGTGLNSVSKLTSRTVAAGPARAGAQALSPRRLPLSKLPLFNLQKFEDALSPASPKARAVETALEEAVKEKTAVVAAMTAVAPADPLQPPGSLPAVGLAAASPEFPTDAAADYQPAAAAVARVLVQAPAAAYARDGPRQQLLSKIPMLAPAKCAVPPATLKAPAVKVVVEAAASEVVVGEVEATTASAATPVEPLLPARQEDLAREVGMKTTRKMKIDRAGKAGMVSAMEEPAASALGGSKGIRVDAGALQWRRNRNLCRELKVKLVKLTEVLRGSGMVTAAKPRAAMAAVYRIVCRIARVHAGYHTSPQRARQLACGQRSAPSCSDTVTGVGAGGCGDSSNTAAANVAAGVAMEGPVAYGLHVPGREPLVRQLVRELVERVTGAQQQQQLYQRQRQQAAASETSASGPSGVAELAATAACAADRTGDEDVNRLQAGGAQLAHDPQMPPRLAPRSLLPPPPQSAPLSPTRSLLQPPPESPSKSAMPAHARSRLPPPPQQVRSASLAGEVGSAAPSGGFDVFAEVEGAWVHVQLPAGRQQAAVGELKQDRSASHLAEPPLMASPEGGSDTPLSTAFPHALMAEPPVAPHVFAAQSPSAYTFSHCSGVNPTPAAASDCFGGLSPEAELAAEARFVSPADVPSCTRRCLLRESLRVPFCSE